MFSVKRVLVVALLGVILFYGLKFYVTYVTVGSKFGQIKGFVSKSRDGRDFSSFLGIPYANPPVGKLRFQPPVAFGSWNGIRVGTQMPPICPQYDPIWKSLMGEEDCLYLNVYTPKNFNSEHKVEKLLPVMVYFHGGHFIFGGSDTYGAEYIMDEDVVLVTLNYRLGALGFLNTGAEARGNMGLKDQVMALKWVQEAIKDFGGKPNLVTIFGESSGGASVNYHMISSRSDGLFHRAISQSGTALCPWSFLKNHQEQGNRLGKALNCPTETTDVLMKCLKKIDALKIVDKQLQSIDVIHGIEAIYAPSIEFYDEKFEDDIFLYEDPHDSIVDDQLARIPLILGVLPEDGCLRAALISHNETKLEEMNPNWNEIAPRAFLYEKDDIVSTQIKEYYFGTKKNKFTKHDYRTLSRIYSDRYFFQCTHEVAISHAKNSPTFTYEMDYQNEISLANIMVAGNGKYPIYLELVWGMLTHRFYKALGWEVFDAGMCHGDDLQHLFNFKGIGGISKDSPHYAFSKDLIQLWVSFAKNGRPSKFRNVEWEEVHPDKELKYLFIGKEPKMIPESFTPGIRFWESLHI